MNFCNLQKLWLENFDKKISLDEPFLGHLTNLEELRLDNVFNHIYSDVKHFFKKLTKLKKLSITNCYIGTIKSSYFDYLVSLEELNLKFDQIRIIEPGSFENLSELKYLDLSHNCIKKIRKKLFSSNHKLERFKRL